MTRLVILLAVHIVLLALASTAFTIVPGVGNGHFQWQAYQYFSQSGWGLPYQFAYSLPVVLTYIAAYSLGVLAYGIAYRSGSRIIGLLGLLLCILGVASFSFELTHWFMDHYRSWIASAPIALAVLAPAAAIQQYRRQRALRDIVVERKETLPAFDTESADIT